MRLARSFRWTVMAAVALAGVAHGQGTPDARRAQTSRAELEALLSQSGNQLDAAERQLLTERLTQGDFQVGDRVALTVLEDPTLTDTFTVQAGRTLTLPKIPDISLDGILRSELQTHLTAELGKFIRNPTVTAVALVRVAVMGAVNRPGYYAVPAQTLLGDVIMVANGPASNADTRKITVRRQTKELLNRDEVQAALTYGTTLDRLNIQGGDEIFIKDKGQGLAPGVRNVIVLITAPLALIFAIDRVF